MVMHACRISGGLRRLQTRADGLSLGSIVKADCVVGLGIIWRAWVYDEHDPAHAHPIGAPVHDRMPCPIWPVLAAASGSGIGSGIAAITVRAAVTCAGVKAHVVAVSSCGLLHVSPSGAREGAGRRRIIRS